MAGLTIAALGGCAMDMDEMGPDAATANESVELGGSPLDFQPIAPCMRESDYAPRGVVRVGLSEAFTPPCVRLATGGTVVFQGWMTHHPLEPRDAGTAPSPILATDSGFAEFEFTDFGFFPYRCAAHADEVGVIWASYAF